MQVNRLSRLQTVYFPLAMLGNDLVSTLKKQTEQYEDAFLSGKMDQATESNRLGNTILQLFDKLELVAAHDAELDREQALISDLRNKYSNFYQLASEVYLGTQAIETSIDLPNKVQTLGSMQTRLLTDLRNLAHHFSQITEQAIHNEQRYAQANNIFLGIFFAFVLVVAALSSRWFANQQILTPLARIQEMVTRFSQNKKVLQPPPQGNRNDEIHKLATSFWNMTEELKQTMVSKNYVDNIIKRMTGSLMVLSPNHSVIKINDNTAKLLGFSEEKMMGRQVTDFVAEESLKLFEEQGLQTLALGEDVINLEIYLTRDDHTKIPVLFSGSVMFNALNTVEAVICVANDITERLKTEEMLRKIEVEQALAKIAALASIGELTSSIAHEMRNPLSSIKMNTKAIQQKMGETNDAFAELGEITIQQSLRLENMLNDLLNYGKPLKLTISATTVRELIDATLSSVNQEKTNKGMVVEITNEIGERVLHLDKELFTRALSNLVLNAIQWSPPESKVHVLIYLSKPSHQSEQIIFKVKDSGQGINKEKSHRIFQPFFTTRQDGTGLGLANVRKIVDYHGGRVTAKNSNSGGAVFTIMIPANLSERHLPS
jgi:PAS domain S-box-containing protein